MPLVRGGVGVELRYIVTSHLRGYCHCFLATATATRLLLLPLLPGYCYCHCYPATATAPRLLLLLPGYCYCCPATATATRLLLLLPGYCHCYPATATAACLPPPHLRLPHLRLPLNTLRTAWQDQTLPGGYRHTAAQTMTTRSPALTTDPAPH